MAKRPPLHSQARRKRWRQKGLLTALGIVFSISALLRIGTLDFAVAQAPSDRSQIRGDEIVMDMSDPQAMAAPGLMRPVQAALSEVLAMRDRLNQREAALADREAAIAAAQILIEDRLAELAEAEQRLQALISLSDSAAETDLGRLTRVYETMEPEDAAPLFEQMSPSFAAGFLSRMAPAAGAAIMAEMTPQAAYAVSVVIATRNVDAPRDTGSAVAPSSPDTAGPTP